MAFTIPRAAARLALVPALLALAACGASGNAVPDAGDAGSDAAVVNPACDLGGDLTAAECATLHAMELATDLPPARGNAYADVPAAATLGFKIFFDRTFSAGQNFRCASCHLPEQHFGDGRATALGIATGTRNSPTALNAARMRWLMWDGRADSVWSQPLLAFENPREMGFTRLEIAHNVAADYGTQYEAVFGPMPDLTDATRFPAAGKPGDPAWEAMSAADQDAVNRIVANVGKSIEAYLRKLATGRAPFDQFLAGDPSALTAAQQRGMAVFVRAGCADCHSGAMLSDERFHNLGVPAAAGDPPDNGRSDGLTLLRASVFNASGPYYDGAASDPVPDAQPGDLGAFRTPTLRNIALSAPYGHNGSFPTLDAVVRFHLSGGGTDTTTYPGSVDPLLPPRALDDAAVADLVAFLGALNGHNTGLPWNNWPDL